MHYLIVKIAAVVICVLQGTPLMIDMEQLSVTPAVEQFAGRWYLWGTSAELTATLIRHDRSHSLQCRHASVTLLREKQRGSVAVLSCCAVQALMFAFLLLTGGTVTSCELEGLAQQLRVSGGPQIAAPCGLLRLAGRNNTKLRIELWTERCAVAETRPTEAYLDF